MPLLYFRFKTNRGENHGAQLLYPIYEIKIKHEFLYHIIAFLYFAMIITVHAASLFRFHSPFKETDGYIRLHAKNNFHIFKSLMTLFLAGNIVAVI